MILLGLAAVVLGALVLVAIVTADARTPTRLLPHAMKGARLLYAERPMQRYAPVLVSGRPDEVWLHEGQLVIIETKRRQVRGNKDRSVYEADRAQIDAYGYLLRDRCNGRGRPVAEEAWIRFVGGDEPIFVRIKVAEDDATIARHRRLHALRAQGGSGLAVRGSASAAVCRGCGHTDICDAYKTRRGI